jgi:hypothetical protein
VGTDPFGNQSILWKSTPDGTAQPNGGWDTSPFTIDPGKLYRYSVWIKKTGSNDGHTYVGCQGNTVSDLNGNVNSNPYFFVGDLPELNKWFLLVGYIHASNDPSTTNYGGIYDGVTGAKVAGLSDFKFVSTATTGVHRTYLYYDYNTGDRQYFFGPEVYKMADNTPSAEVLTNLIVGGTLQSNNGATIYKTYADTDLNTSWSGTTWLRNTDVTDGSFSRLSFVSGPDGMGAISVKRTAAFTGEMWFQVRPGSGYYTTPMVIKSTGNIGIGTTSPDSKLSVKGQIHAQEVKVDLNGAVAPDYVFSKDYKLPSLEDIQSYIEANQHLPEVPSAKEMEEKGINVGEMNLLLLKKVEELTLHLIAESNARKKLEQEVAELKTKK